MFYGEILEKSRGFSVLRICYAEKVIDSPSEGWTRIKVFDNIMENEELILFFCEGEIIHSTVKLYSELGVHFYCIHNQLEIIETLRFCGFTMILTKRK